MAREKLVRDRIKEFSEASKDGRLFRMATGEEMSVLLVWKLLEECQELTEELLAETTREHLLEEMADVVEVIHGICNFLNFSPEEVEKLRKRKKEAKGGFEKGLVLDLETNPCRIPNIDKLEE